MTKKFSRADLFAFNDATGNFEVRDKSPNEPCKMFLLCDNPATTIYDHPTLGGVPACARCAAKMARLAGDKAKFEKAAAETLFGKED